MRPIALASVAAIALSASGACADSMKMAGPNSGASDSQIIASAMSAAPASVSAHATIITMMSDGKMRTVRQGTNGFTCMPDNPASPGPDPMCMDANAYAWAQAYLAHKKPDAGKIGFIYMLAGGSDASNTDPYATKPAANGHWISTPPHVMVVNAPQSYYAAYPTSADPDTSQPYVMWAGTPYQHTMIPVK